MIRGSKSVIHEGGDLELDDIEMEFENSNDNIRKKIKIEKVESADSYDVLAASALPNMKPLNYSGEVYIVGGDSSPSIADVDRKLLGSQDPIILSPSRANSTTSFVMREGRA